ncbi:MAG: lysophospholipid acyltransferase family protein [Sandaracinaceae bacterium]|nr:lysophospholipid acyltransferase family protein [Sandaracinaceae bacterium]
MGRDWEGNSIGDLWVKEVGKWIGIDIDARLSQIPRLLNEANWDSFGFDPRVARHALALAALLYRFYFRVRTRGIERVPQGRVLLIANHSGQLPFDGAMLATALVLEANPPRLARSMVERWSAELPFVSFLFPRLGQVVGTPDNARRLLEADEALIVFPEGSRGISKTFDRRYQLVEFGLGFMRLALATGTPIVPVAIVGPEEQYISVANLTSVAKLLGMPAFPIIPQFFFGFLLPLPVRYFIEFGEPLHFEGDPDDEDTVIESKVVVVKNAIRGMLHRLLRERKSVFL